ncbi:ChrA protein [Cohnella sp. CIP 111063]|uniref:chromate transporter n=1 Tax=unclassified Cohnella TaxID=2636738 RepID=UPI000B8C3DCC|nr:MULTISPECIES: chromate transporter [unclassified Cohnella]OXS57347.1 ChrA protein [Cohnella sp. CIP 111063]PRX70789.1 chromate transporter [Cohnella sp. SGD-V74]
MNVGQQETGRNSSAKAASVWEVLRVSTKLGLTSFGGPVAHLGYFHDEYVRRRKWMDERSYADLVALCQFLPGPASSQVGIGIGIARAGLWGGFAAWAGFTLPSVVALALFAFVLQGYDLANAGWIHGLKIVAAAIVAHAIVGMGQKLTPDRDRVTIAAAAATITLLWPEAYVQVFLILVSGMLGLRLYRGSKETAGHHIRISICKGVAVGCLALFFVLLVTLPLLRQAADIEWIALFDSFYRSGSLVFGGGHVVLPLLEREVVPTGWVSQEHFLAGYSAAQAVPGPLFTFAGYLGAMSGGMTGVAAATIAIFLPSFLLVVGVLPFWSELRSNPNVQGALVGINAAVVGILLAALYDPLWTTAILSAADFALALLLFIMLVYWRLPPWIVVVVGAIGGVLLEYL